MEEPQWKPGVRVLTRYGEIKTVARQSGVRVFMQEDCNAWYHPAYLRRLETELETTGDRAGVVPVSN